MASMTMSARPAMRSTMAAAPARSFRAPRVQPRPQFRAMATPQTEDKSAVETAIESAKESCESGTTGECAAAWDEVEELSAEASHKKANKGSSDPLDAFCEDNPDADECRVYED